MNQRHCYADPPSLAWRPGWLAIVPLALLSGCHPATVEAKKAPEVQVTTPVVGTVVDYQDFTGRIDAIKAGGHAACA